MSEHYDVYKSRQRRSRTKEHKSSPKKYSQKLKKQLFFSIICLVSVYLIKISGSDTGNLINGSIKKALESPMNTQIIQSGITNMLEKIINKDTTA